MAARTLRVIPLCGLIFSAAFGRCAGGDVTQAPPPPDAGMLLWSDEFDGDAGSPPDTNNWSPDVGGSGWGNSQLEYDTDFTHDNVQLDGQGHLAIIARRESFGGNGYTSGRITTHGHFESHFGRFEASIQSPVGQGIWPAFWVLGDNGKPWPTCGEIDIMEEQGQNIYVNHGSMHGPGYSGGGAISAQYRSSAALDDGFHLFAIDWLENEVDFSVDGIVYNRVTPDNVPAGDQWVFNDHDFYIILNVAVGGNYVGSPSSSTVFPQTMLVDYVRVYGPAQ